MLVCLARDPGVRVRDIALAVGLTERAAQMILADLVDAGYVDRERVGRRNQYRIRPDQPLRHRLERHLAIGRLLALLGPEDRT